MTTELQVGLDRRTLDPRAGFETHREFLEAVHDAGRGVLDERLVPLQASTGSDEAGEYSDPAGGFLVPAAWSPRALTRGVDDPTLGRTTSLSMETPIVHIAARVDSDHSTSVSAGIAMIRHAEATDVTPSRFAMEAIELNSYELFGVTFASSRLVMDSPRTFVDLIERCYQDETTSVMLEERIRGTGTGEFLGVLNSGALITVAKETGQAAGSVLGMNFAKMRARCWGYSRAIWIVRPELFPQVMTATVVVGDAGSALPIWQPGNDADGIPDRILGRPAFFHDAASAVGAVGDVVLCNWAEYIDATWVPLRADSSIFVRFVATETAFRFYMRNDGTPWWRTPLTPKRSTVTVSPFVTLAART